MNLIMKKAVKILIVSIFSVIFVLCMCAGLSACAKGGGNAGNGDVGGVENPEENSYGKWDEYEGVKIAFADEKTFNDGEIDESKVLPELNCKPGEKQYMIIDFDIQAPYDNDGRDSVTAEVKIQPAAAVAATIQETNSGNVSEETLDGIREIKATYKIPEAADSVRNMRLVIQLNALKGSEVYLDLSFKNENGIQAVKTEEIKKTAEIDYTKALTYSAGGKLSGKSDGTNNITVPIMKDGYYVTEIADEAFYGCGITEITLPSGLNSIGEKAFADCYKLENVTIPDSVTSIGKSAFAGCGKLKNITVPDGVTEIAENLFHGCGGLTSITIPDSVTSIGSGAFGDCSGLESISLPFTGESNNGENNTHFGYIFGANDYSNNSYCVPASLKTAVITQGTAIADKAFYGCDGLESITIPTAVTDIGSSAFENCRGLTVFTMPEGVSDIGSSAFCGCSGLTEITIPKGVAVIDTSAFKGCGGLTEIVIPEGVTDIGTSAFEGCSGLTEITVPDSVTYIGYGAFKDCTKIESVTLPFVGNSDGGHETNFGYIFGASNFSFNSKFVPASIKTVIITGGYKIDFGAFKDCDGIENITLPFVGESKDCETNKHFGYIFGARYYSDNNESVPASLKAVTVTDGTVIGDNAFRCCSGLTGITIPDTVTGIGGYSFYGCSALTSITIPDGVTSIGNEAFHFCSALENINIPSGVTSIAYMAFSNCESLKTVTIPYGVTGIGGYAFAGCSGLKSISIPDSVTTINNYAFKDCVGLTSIALPDGLTSISAHLFDGCGGLTSLELPSGVTSIGEYAFAGCSSLESIEIPDGVKRINAGLISGCSNLNRVTLPLSITNLEYGAFFNNDKFININYLGTKEQWAAIKKTSGWNNGISIGVICTDGFINNYEL